MITSEDWDKPIQLFALPTRILNWAGSKGIRTLRELLVLQPAALERERDLGRASIEKARLLLESRFGRTWEELRAELSPRTVDSATGTQASDKTTWQELTSSLPHDVLHLELNLIEMPPQMRAYAAAHGCVLVRDLVDMRDTTLLQHPSIGQKSVNDVRSQLVELALRPEHEPDSRSAMAAFKYHVSRLGAVPTMVVQRRSALLGRSDTLQELATELGVTRERIKQAETHALQSLRRSQEWIDETGRRLQAVMGGTSAELLQIAQDPWWSDLAENSEAFSYLLDKVLDSNLRIVVCGDVQLLSAQGQTEIDRQWAELVAEAEDWPYPVDNTFVAATIADCAARLGSGTAAAFSRRLDDYLHWEPRTDDDTQQRVLAFGRDRSSDVLTYLSQQPHPVRLTQLHDAVGRGRLPNEVLHFDNGIVGLEKHFPDYREWSQTLPSSCVQVMEESAPDRQWHASELLAALRDADVVPDWMNEWKLASILRCSKQVEYLGRLRVALLQEDDAPELINYEEAILDCLTDHGAPLALEAIAQDIRRQADVSSATLSHTLNGQLFFQDTDDGTWGLIARDLPGGHQGAQEVRDLVLDALEEQQHGFTSHQLWRFLQDQGGCNPSWSEATAVSVLRSDPRLRMTKAGSFGLAMWDTVKVPSQTDILEQLLVEFEGRVQVADFQQRVASLYGRTVDDQGLASSLNELGTMLNDDVISVQPTARKTIVKKTMEAKLTLGLIDPPKPHLPVESACAILSAYTPPEKPALDAALKARVIEMIEDLVDGSGSAEPWLIEKYIDDKLHLLGFSAVPWKRELGRAAYALRQLQLHELDDELELDMVTLRVIRAGLFYLVKRDDVIPDETADIGYIDDAHAVCYCAKRTLQNLSIGAPRNISSKAPGATSKRASTQRLSIDEMETETVMAAFRQVAREGIVKESEFLRDVNFKLGNRRLGSRIRDRLKGHLRAALRRRIVERDGKYIKLASPSFSSYSTDELVELLSSVMKGKRRYLRDDVIADLSSYLGFSRVTEGTRRHMKTVFTSAIRRSSLTYKGQEIWRTS